MLKISKEIKIIINEGTYPNEFRYDIYKNGIIIGAFSLKQLIKDKKILKNILKDYGIGGSD